MHARARARHLPDGRRLHLQDGPIDLIIEASGSALAVQAAYSAAVRRFSSVLDELCAELAALRSPDRAVEGAIARAMAKAVRAVSPAHFITPMAAVAGAVADEILRVMLDAASEDLRRAYVNNGGDIAIHLAQGEVFRIGLVSHPERPALYGQTCVTAADGIGGIASSGVPGRSFSLGVADAVTILADNAAFADAAATVVANAVDLPGDARIRRAPAASLQPDSDLGELLVTRSVGELDPESIHTALERGCEAAAPLVARGLIVGAALHLQGETRLCGERRAIEVAPRLARKESVRHA